jgi:endonuclease YncB( thermonuclease family)
MTRYILAVATIIFCFASADASSLFGRVIEVNSGDVITIFNLNRPVRVKLMGVDAPEMNQAFGDVARKHLSDLVFEKSVLVEYAGIAADSSLTGRVLLNDADIGAQMIRDGAAWFDPVHGNRLSPTNREVYEQSEVAARNEKRGLWQQENPVAPWEFVKAEAMRRNSSSSSTESVTEPKPRRSGPAPELNNLTLMAGRTNAAPPQSASSDETAWVRSGARKKWGHLQPPGENFSVAIPEDGEYLTRPAPVGGQMVDVKGYRVRDGWAVYSVAWFKAPTLGESDDLVFKPLLKQFMETAAESYKIDNRRDDFNCRPPAGTKISQNGYTGVEFDLSSCKVPWRVRMYTKVVDDERQMYIAATAYAEEDAANALRFLRSFTVGRVGTVTR